MERFAWTGKIKPGMQAESPIVDRWNAYMADVLELVMDPATGAQPKLQQMFLLE